MEEQILKCEIILDKIFFPKYANVVQSGEYAIFSATITKDLSSSKEIEIYDKIKIKGNVCKLEFGTVYKISCKLLETHEIYGETYEIIYISKKIDISSKEKQREFLSNIINENIVDNLFKQYDDVLTLLDNKDTESLTKVKGIGNNTALRIIDEYEDAKDYSAIYTELGKLGLTHTFVKKLTDFYNSPETVIDIIKNNPYELVKVEGIGFKKADEIATKMGMSQNDYRRIKGFLLYTLNEQGEMGKSYLYYSELIKALYDTLGFVPEEVINQTAKSMMEYKDIIVLDDGNRIALTKYYNLETNIKNELLRLLKGIQTNTDLIDDEISIYDDYIPKVFDINNFDEIIKQTELEQGYDFTEEQSDAIKMSLNNYVMALTGLAGSGKTSTANGICKLYDDYKIIAVALSGKASVRITEATGLPASTIHRALGYGNGVFTYDKHNKLSVDIVLIDEATMINGTLFLSLLEAIPNGAKVVIMGDVQQLTPIGNCQIFADILDSGILPTVKLTKPHRQAMLSGIIPTSIKVANQEPIFKKNFEGIEILGKLQDMELNIQKDKTNLCDLIIEHFTKELQKNNNIIELQIIVAMKTRGELNCFNLNNRIQELYNPKLNDCNEIEVFVEKKKDEIKKYNIRVGDKVINIKNNYKCVNTEGVITPVFNGNIGIVKEITDDKYCTVDFIGIGEIILSKTETKSLVLAYAISIHKSQGSGFNTVIVGLDSGSFKLNNSELLYTAITRAKKYCILVGNDYAINTSISKKEVKTKQTFLKEFLREK